MDIKISKEKLTKPAGVFFELEGVLYNSQKTREEELQEIKTLLKERYEVKEKAIAEAFATSSSFTNPLAAIKGALDTLSQKTEGSLSLSLAKTYIQNYLAALTAAEGTKKFLSELKSAGITRVVLTDTPLEIALRTLIVLGLDKDFDFVVSSEEVGERKPSAKVFYAGLSKLSNKEGSNKEGTIWLFAESAENDLKPGKTYLNSINFSKTKGEQTDVYYREFSELDSLISGFKPEDSAFTKFLKQANG